MGPQRALVIGPEFLPQRGGQPVPDPASRNRLFDDMMSRFEGGMPSLFGRGAGWPSVEIVETDKEVRVAAELPGLEDKDVEVLVNDDVLTIRGERKAEIDDRERHFSERYYGHFERRIPLPFEVEDDRAEASFENGVLTVTLPKSAKAQARTKRIAVKGKPKKKTAEVKH